MVMQDVNHQLFCETVEEEVQLGMCEENQFLVEKTLESLDLKEVIYCHPMSLSGGQKQRVAIASSMLAGKELLVFDEPTSGLDYHHMVQTAECIKKLKKKKTVIIVTHDFELISQCCTHVLVMKNGHVDSLCQRDEDGVACVRDFLIERSAEN